MLEFFQSFPWERHDGRGKGDGERAETDVPARLRDHIRSTRREECNSGAWKYPIRQAAGVTSSFLRRIQGYRIRAAAAAPFQAIHGHPPRLQTGTFGAN